MAVRIGHIDLSTFDGCLICFQAFAIDFSFQVDNYNNGNPITFLQDGTDTFKGKNTLTVPAGTYSITEPGVSGYTTTLSTSFTTCTNRSDSSFR